MDGPIVLSVADLLGGGRPGAAAKPGEKRPIPEAQIATLREAFARYGAACPFKPGDIVTPRKGFGYSDAGEPHVVLEVAEQPIRNFEPGTDVTNVASSAFGCKLDVRVACFSERRMGGEIDVVPFWQESWRLEAYKQS